MKLLLSLLLSGGLMTAPILAETSVETPVEEEMPTETETPEKEVLEELIAKWLNGEIELDKETLDEILTQLEPEVDKMLQEYIADNEERQLVTSIIMGIIAGLGLIVIMFMYTRKIAKATSTATDNNSKFSVTSKQIKETSQVISKDVESLKGNFKDLESIVKSDAEANLKTKQIIDEALKMLNKKIDGLAGILTIINKEEGTGNEEKASSKK